MSGRSRLTRIALASWMLIALGTASVRAGCEYKTFPHERQASSKHTRGHKTGKHRAKARAKFTCQCEHTCRSNCDVEWAVSPICEDTGRVRGPNVHRVYSDERLTSGSKANALSGGGANCGAAFGCFVEACLPLLCSGISITIKGQPLGMGAGVTFSTSPQPYWGATLEIPFECEGCWTSEEVSDELERIGEEFIPIEDGGLNGTASVYKMCYWECESGMGSDDVFYESCTLIECLFF